VRSAPEKTRLITEAVNRYAALLASGTADDIAALFTDGATAEDPVGSEVRRGRGQIRELYANIENYERASELVTVKVVGNEAAFLIRLPVTAGSRRNLIEGIDVMTFNDDAQITAFRAFWSPD
jgi:steroid Delta-isomerase